MQTFLHLLPQLPTPNLRSFLSSHYQLKFLCLGSCPQSRNVEGCQILPFLLMGQNINYNLSPTLDLILKKNVVEKEARKD